MHLKRKWSCSIPHLHFRCNPFFVRCIKPNHLKVDIESMFPPVIIVMREFNLTLSCRFSLNPLPYLIAFSNQACLRTIWSAASWDTQGSWRQFGSVDRGILSECHSPYSCSGNTDAAIEIKLLLTRSLTMVPILPGEFTVNFCQPFSKPLCCGSQMFASAFNINILIHFPWDKNRYRNFKQFANNLVHRIPGSWNPSYYIIF